MAFFVVVCIILLLCFLILKTKFACRKAMLRLEGGLVGQYVNKMPPSFRVYLLLPAHREQKIVSSSLDHFALLMRDHAQVSAVVITSEQETRDKVGRATTAELVDFWCAKNSDIPVERLHDPNISGSKATKLRFAVDVLTKRHSDLRPSRIMFGVYDFDSRPMLSTLCELAVLSQAELQPIVQQIPYPVSSISYLPAPSAGRVLGIGHLERALGHEGERYNQVDDAFRHKRTAPFLRGCMGAGLFVRADVLDRIGGFPTFSDDIVLGYRLDLRRIERITMIAPNFVQPAPSAGAALRQLVRIYFGVYAAIPEVLRSPAEANFAHLRAAAMTHVRDAEPAARVVLSVVAVLVAIGGESPFLALFSIFAAWALHFWLFRDLVSYAEHLSSLSGEYSQMKLHPVEWTGGPIAQGLLRLATFILYIINRHWSFETLESGVGSTPRIDN